MLKTRQVIHGGIGLIKAGAGIEKASDEVIKYRLSLCNECEEKIYVMSKVIGKNVSKCKVCGCFIKAKTLLKSEACGKNKWDIEQ